MPRLHGDADVVYTGKNAEEEVILLMSSSEAKPDAGKGGHHCLKATHVKEVNEALLKFMDKNATKFEEKVSRQAIVMVKI